MKRRFVAINRTNKRVTTIVFCIILGLIILIMSFKWIFGLIVSTVINEEKQLDLLNLGTSNVRLLDFNLLNPNDILSVSLNIKKDKSEKLEIVKREETGPLVYIYNTHDEEKYTFESIKYASKLLKDELFNYGIPALVEEESISDYLKENGKNINEAFNVSRSFIDKAMRDNETLRYFIDIHTTNTSRDVTSIKIEEDNYAKVLFIVSMNGKFYERQMSFAETLNSMLDNRLSRGIMKKNDIDNFYNQDMDAYCLTLEIGSSESTSEEIDNTVKVLGEILHEYMSEGYNGN